MFPCMNNSTGTMEGRVTFLIFHSEQIHISLPFLLCHTLKRCSGTRCGKEHLKQNRFWANPVLLKINQGSTVLILKKKIKFVSLEWKLLVNQQVSEETEMISQWPTKLTSDKSRRTLMTTGSYSMPQTNLSVIIRENRKKTKLCSKQQMKR